MHFLDTSTLQIRDHDSHAITEDDFDYAILSHVWEREVSYQEMLQDPRPTTLTEKFGYAKIEGACSQALNDGYQLIWIDTCCIGKSSSAELSEAINSMYAWYKHSSICYAYLFDVPSKKYNSLPLSSSQHSALWNKRFSESKWFSRWWTLQELLAPSQVVLYSREWADIGTKATLQKEISKRTRIKTSVLVNNPKGNIDLACVAEKMSWAAERNTTRPEDIAYCLMGIFGMHMPILYGEGKDAFIRLQKEIIASSNDHTIFAWDLKDGKEPFDYVKSNSPGVLRPRGILASSPNAFSRSGALRQTSHYDSFPYSFTNMTLNIQLYTIPVSPYRYCFGRRDYRSSYQNTCYWPCQSPDENADAILNAVVDDRPIIVRLRKCQLPGSSMLWERQFCYLRRIESQNTWQPEPKLYHIPATSQKSHFQSATMNGRYWFIADINIHPSCKEYGYSMCRAFPPNPRTGQIMMADIHSNYFPIFELTSRYSLG
jgi:hypothetical protein